MIGAGSVVTQSVPPYAIVYGTPAKVKGYLQTTPSLSSENPTALTLSPLANDSTHSKLIGVGGVTLHQLQLFHDRRGNLSVGEFMKDIPFQPNRYFVIFNVPEEEVRGQHAHLKCHQFLICTQGSCTFGVDDGHSRGTIVLNKPDQGLYIPSLVWGIQYQYSKNASLMVFASHFYDEKDYIKSYSDFIQITQSSNGIF